MRKGKKKHSPNRFLKSCEERGSLYLGRAEYQRRLKEKKRRKRVTLISTTLEREKRRPGRHLNSHQKEAEKKRGKGKKREGISLSILNSQRKKRKSFHDNSFESSHKEENRGTHGKKGGGYLEKKKTGKGEKSTVTFQC